MNFRVQPYVPGIFADVLRGIPKWAEAGVHGIILEGMKYSTPVIQGLVSVGNDYCYASEVLLPQFKAIRESAHKRGMKFYCGENRLRALSDELCCCGVEGMGWKVNTANLNHALFDRPGFQFTPKMEEKGTAMAFHAMEQTTLASKELPLCSYREKMEQRVGSPYPYMESSVRFTAEQGEQIRQYFRAALKAAGITAAQVDRHLGTRGMAGHYFGASQWCFPTPEAYEKMRQILPLADCDTLLKQYGVNTRGFGRIYGCDNKR